MKPIFLTVLGMSGTASLVILAVLLARLALRKAPKIYSYILWSVVLFRLLCPFAIQSRWGMVLPIQVEPSTDSMVSITTDRTGVVISVGEAPGYAPAPAGPSAPVQLPDLPSAPAPAAPLPPTQTTSTAPSWPSAAGAVWLTGAVLLAGYSVLSLLLLRRRLVGAVPLTGEKNVYLADHIPSPFVLGLFQPRIYLPSGLPEGEREYILLHERTHIRRLDHVTRALAWLALSIHWFNPLVWLAFHLAGKDMEMSCDEAVLRKMGRDVRADYSSSLLRLSVGGRLPAGPLAFGGGDPEKRIKNVLNYKKPAFWVAALALIGVLCAGVALGTDRTEETPDTSGVDLDGIAADITMSMDQGKDGVPFVRIEGTVDGIGLERTIWNPPEWFETYEVSSYPLGQLWFEAPLCDGEVVCALDACWTDEDRTSVKVTATPRALISSYSNAGNLIFAVDLSRDGGALAELEGHVPKLAPNAPELVPTEEEAVKIGRIAAKVLTAAEDYYKRTISSVKTQSPAAASDLAASYSRFRTGYVEVGGLDCLGAFWQPATRHMWANDGMGLPEEGLLGVLCIDTPRFFGGRFAEAAGTATVGYFPEENSPLVFVAFCDYVPPDSGDGRMTSDGTFFIVDLASGAVRFPEWAGYDAVDPGLSDGELASLAQALAQVIQGASDFYNSPAYEEWYTLLESGGVQLCRVGDAYVEWGSSSDPDGPGSLYFAGDPLFCCTSLELIGRNVEGAAHWLDERTFRVNFTVDDERAPSTGTVAGFRIEFTVDMDSRAVTSRDFQSQVAGETLELDDVEMVGMASRLNELMKEAARFYADSTGRAGPLPLKGPMKLMLASGAGSWGSLVTLCSDGSFDGHYSDTDGETQYVCWFHGQFGDIRQVSAASWSMKLEELVLDTGHPIGEEWEEPGDIFHYISSLPIGFVKEDGQGKIVALEPGAEFVFYTPEASSKPGGELYGMEDPSSDLHDFWYWWPGSYHSTGEGDFLNCYGLRNVEGGHGFFDSWMS